MFALTSTSLLVTSTRAYVRVSHSSSIAVKENASLPFSSPPLPDFLMLIKNKKKEANAALSPTKISPRNRDATGERFLLFSLPHFVPLSSWISLSLIYIIYIYYISLAEQQKHFFGSRAFLPRLLPLFPFTFLFREKFFFVLFLLLHASHTIFLE